MALPNRCQICGEPTTRPTRMCAECRAAYDRHAHETGSVMDAILWAAKRARWYAERRTAQNVRKRDQAEHQSQARDPRREQIVFFKAACRSLDAVARTGLALYVTPGTIHLLDGPSHDASTQARALRENIVESARVYGISGGDW